MAAGKAINKGFSSESEGVKGKEIAMPPLPEENQSEDMMAVPEQVDQSVYNEMSNQESPEPEQEESEQASEEPKEVEKPSAKESFRSIREAKEKAERERDAIITQMMEQQEQKKSFQSRYKEPEAPPVDDDIDFNIDEDSLVEGRYVKKVTNRIKNLENQLINYENRIKQQTTESKIIQQYPDFAKVVSEENVAMLNHQFPELAQTLSNNNDLYSKAASTYAVMKKFGIHRDDPHKEDRIKAMANTQKPKPLTSISPQQGDTPLSKANAFANGLTEDLKAQLRKEMLAARRSM